MTAAVAAMLALRQAHDERAARRRTIGDVAVGVCRVVRVRR